MKVNAVKHRLELRQESFEQFVRVYIQKTDERLNQMDRDMQEFRKKHDEDMAAINKKFDKIDEKFNKIDQKFDKIDEKFEKLNDKIDGFAKYMQTLTVTTVIGIAAIAVSVIVFVAKS